MVKNTYTKGENIINIKDITIKTGSASQTYDGKPLSNEDDLSIVSGELNDGDYLICDKTKSIPSITDAGSISNVLTPKIIDSTTGEDHTANYNITVNYGTLTVNKRPVTLYSYNKNYNYDGTYVSYPGVSVGGDGFVKNEVISIKATGKFKDPGVYENKPIVITWADGADPNNYDITYDYGTITINQTLKPPIVVGASISNPGVDNKSTIDENTNDGASGGNEF